MKLNKLFLLSILCRTLYTGSQLAPEDNMYSCRCLRGMHKMKPTNDPNGVYFIFSINRRDSTYQMNKMDKDNTIKPISYGPWRYGNLRPDMQQLLSTIPDSTKVRQGKDNDSFFIPAKLELYSFKFIANQIVFGLS